MTTPTHPDNPDPIQLLNQTQAAEVLAVNPRTLEGWRFKGGGPRFVRVGRRVRYRMRDLRAWIEERTFESTTEADHRREA
jgi:hypothetical protein